MVRRVSRARKGSKDYKVSSARKAPLDLKAFKVSKERQSIRAQLGLPDLPAQSACRDPPELQQPREPLVQQGLQDLGVPWNRMSWMVAARTQTILLRVQALIAEVYYEENPV